MDARARGWYFSTMGRAGRGAVSRVHEVGFHRTKYGPELLVDAAFVRDMPTFLRVPTPHALAFYDLLLVTRGAGRYRLDGRAYAVRPGTLFFTRPGEHREWRVSGLDGACLFFTEEFVTEAFSDARFLDRWPYFVAERPSAALRLQPAQRRFFLQRFDAMRREIRMLRKDAPHALRAVLYELLVALGRWYSGAHGSLAQLVPHPTVERFRALLERDFAARHRVSDYARSLGLSPGHLSLLCRRHLRRSAGELVRARLALEARRLLAYADLGAAQVADRLGFADPAYFARFVRRELGASPSALRGR
jgi:AraC-like DNA-binding protein